MIKIYHQASSRLDMMIKIYLRNIFNYQASPRPDMIIKFYLRKTFNYQASPRA